MSILLHYPFVKNMIVETTVFVYNIYYKQYKTGKIQNGTLIGNYRNEKKEKYYKESILSICYLSQSIGY